MIKHKNHIIASLLMLLLVSTASAYGSSQLEMDDLLLTFSYPSVGRIYVSARYDYTSQRVYLPAREIMGVLGIQVQRTGNRRVVSGTYLTGGSSYSIDMGSFEVTHGSRRKRYDTTHIMPGETDVYVSLDVLRDMFDLDFTANMMALTLSLQTPHVMPIVEREQRELARQRINELSSGPEIYPLRFGRQRSVIRPGFIDYSASSSQALHMQQMSHNYQLIGGIEFLGGDLQGSHSGVYTPDGNFLTQTGNLRLQYVIPETSWISRITMGQVVTSGLNSYSIRGGSITNDPIRSRITYGNYLVKGKTEPDSEIEIYVNNQLIQFDKADALGDYEFIIPLQFGNTVLSRRIYTPNGAIIASEQKIVIPYLFLPPGVVSYNVQSGLIESSFNFMDRDKLATHAGMGVGVTNWLTLKAGSEFVQDREEPIVHYGGLSMRVLGQTLINSEIVPSYFYRTQASYISSRAHSFNMEHTYFEGNSVYNTRQADQQFNVSMYTPLRLNWRRSRAPGLHQTTGKSINAGLRLGTDVMMFGQRSETRYVTDLFLRVRAVNLRLNYRDNLFFNHSTRDLQSSGGQLSSSLTYTLPRGGALPRWMIGSYMRFSASYDQTIGEFRQLESQIVLNLPGNGRLTLGGNHQVQSGQTSYLAGINIDFKRRVRTNTDYRGTNTGSHIVRQTLRGSIGIDDRFNQIILSDRQQVGLGAASILLYVDENNSGTYDRGEQKLPYAAVRLDRSAGVDIGTDQVLRLSQLQSYQRYNLEVDRGAIPNPQLVPAFNKVSFIADPNQYKRIEIPFYRSGSIDGMVSSTISGGDNGVGGLRLLINGLNNDHSQVVRTFYGGTFFAMDLPPGDYTIGVDPVQLEFMGLTMKSGLFPFTIQNLAEGDYLTDLHIILEPTFDEVSLDFIARAALEQELRESLTRRANRAIRLYVMAQAATYDGRLNEALQFINTSLIEMETDYGYALKGSITYLLGDIQGAQEIWEMLLRRNPSISIPVEIDSDGINELRNLIIGDRDE